MQLPPKTCLRLTKNTFSEAQLLFTCINSSLSDIEKMRYSGFKIYLKGRINEETGLRLL